MKNILACILLCASLNTFAQVPAPVPAPLPVPVPPSLPVPVPQVPTPAPLPVPSGTADTTVWEPAEEWPDPEEILKTSDWRTHRVERRGKPAENQARVGAICRDGTTSKAKGSGACSGHGGVAYWLYESAQAPGQLAVVPKEQPKTLPDGSPQTAPVPYQPPGSLAKTDTGNYLALFVQLGMAVLAFALIGFVIKKVFKN